MYIPDDVFSIIKDYYYQFKIVERKKKLIEEFKNNYIFEFINKEHNILDIKKNKYINYYLNEELDGELYGTHLQYLICTQRKDYKKQKSILLYQKNYKTSKNKFDIFFHKPGLFAKIYTLFDQVYYTELYNNNIICTKKNSKYHINFENCDND